MRDEQARKAVDEAALRLWLAYRDMDDVVPIEDWDSLDCQLWEMVTMHRGIQGILRRSAKYRGVHNRDIRDA